MIDLNGVRKHLATLLEKDEFLAEYGAMIALYFVQQKAEFIGFGALVEQGFVQVYLVSQHLGLYEKYGYVLMKTTQEDIHKVDYLYKKFLD